jgi:hypothetical protein
MSTEHMILGSAAAFFVVCLVLSLKGGRKISVASLAMPIGKAKHPIRAAFEALEEEAKEAAAKLIASEFGAQYASEYREKLRGTLSPKAPAGPSSSSSG